MPEASNPPTGYLKVTGPKSSPFVTARSHASASLLTPLPVLPLIGDNKSFVARKEKNTLPHDIVRPARHRKSTRQARHR